jgi:predicted GNAT family acetyltransferase
MKMEIRDNRELGQFETGSGAGTALVAYRRKGKRITFTHTEVAPELRGQGVGEALAQAALEAARAEGLEVVPLCPFIAAYIRRHPEFADLVAS